MKLNLRWFFVTLFCTTINFNQAQGSDIVFLIDNSATITNENGIDEFANLTTSINAIIANVINCPDNRVSVVHYAANLQTEEDPSLSRIYIENDFTNDITIAQSFERRFGGGDYLHDATRVLGFALDNSDNIGIHTDGVQQLTPLASNDLIVFIFTDADRANSGSASFLVSSINPDPNTDLAFRIFTNFKEQREATFFVVHRPPNNTARDAAAAIASGGGPYNPNNVEYYPSDPDNNAARYYYQTNNFILSQAEVNTISEDLCAINADPCDIIFPEINETLTQNGCSAIFTGSNNGNVCSNQVYSWSVYLNANTTPIFQATNQISIDESDYSFSQNPGNYTIELTISNSNVTSSSITTTFLVPEDCQGECEPLTDYWITDGNTLNWNGTAPSYTLTLQEDPNCNGQSDGQTIPQTVTVQLQENTFNLNDIITQLGTCVTFNITSDCDDTDWCSAQRRRTNWSIPENCVVIDDGCNSPISFLLNNFFCWQDVSEIYNIEIISDNTCSNGDQGAFNTLNFSTTENCVDLRDIVDQLGRKCFKIRITYNDDCPATECLVQVTQGGFSIEGQCSVANDKSVTNTSVKAFPNPASNQFMVMSNYSKIKSMTLYNFYGKTIKTFNAIKASKKQINVSDLTPGYYVLKVYLEDGSVQHKNIIVN